MTHDEEHLDPHGECAHEISRLQSIIDQLPKGLVDVAAERRRHVEVEGWTPEHDDEHGDGELAQAAACYILGSTCESTTQVMLWWKPSPKDRRRDLVKAGALIVAEIERLDRAAAITSTPN